jgi:hypothetical protein
MDSAPFLIQIHDDTLPEHPDSILYVIRNYGSAASIGADSTLLFILNDDDLPATISFVTDSDAGYMHDGTYSVCISINNPNPFYVRYSLRTYDAWNYPLQTAYGGYDYLYDWGTRYAPPGISTFCQNITIIPDTNLSPASKTFICAIQNIDANNIIDSFFHFTIINDNYYSPMSVSFDINSLTVKPDTTVLVGIPITIVNPNHRAYRFQIIPAGFMSNVSLDSLVSDHIRILNSAFSRGWGTFHDTLWLTISQPTIVSDTDLISLQINGVMQNTSPDTVFHLTLIGPDTLHISFLGAGFSHLKSDSIGYVKLFTSSPVKYPVSADIRLLSGSATPGVDFIFHDTTVIFPPYTYDTISLQIIMLKDHLRQGNEQINLSLTNVLPANVITDIVQYTYTIIDDDSTAVSPTGISRSDKPESISIHPNPFSDRLNIMTDLPDYTISIADPLGENVYYQNHMKGNFTIDLKQLPCGWYVMSVYDGQTTHRSKLIKD